jgi:hypothetical protein
VLLESCNFVRVTETIVEERLSYYLCIVVLAGTYTATLVEVEKTRSKATPASADLMTSATRRVAASDR